MSEKGKVGTPATRRLPDPPGAVHLYDGINLAALAIVEAKSTSPSVYALHRQDRRRSAGAMVVYSFAPGIAAAETGQGHPLRRPLVARRIRLL